MPTLAQNRYAYHDYEILQELEAGISLSGAEVKSAKTGHVQMKDSYVRINRMREAYLFKCHIAPYSHARNDFYDPEQPRKLLLNRSEITSLDIAMHGQNLTIIPLKMYTTRKGLIKVGIGLARGKKKHDKRRALQERESKREIQRTLKKYS